MSLVKRRSIIAFFVLAYALSWWPVPFGSFIPAGPLLAALIVIPITQGRAGLREEEGPRLPDLDPLLRYPFGAASATRPYLALTTEQFHNGHPIEVVRACYELGKNRIGMRIPRSAWILRDLRFPHS